MPADTSEPAEPSRQRGTYAKGIARRQEILDRAIEVFAERGADRTSLRAIAPDTATDSAKPEADKPKQTQYDFYTLLPGEGVQMSDAELAASAKAEAEAQAKAAQQPDPATTATADGSLPAPIAETPAATPATAVTTSTSWCCRRR